MRLIFFTIYLGILHGQVLDEMYHTTDEIYEFLDTLNRSEHVGHLVHLDTIGYSTQDNIPIIAVRISDNAHIKEDEPRVLFIGQVHAEEIMGVEVVISLIKDLLFPDISIQNHMNILVQYLDIWLIPTANPEGLNVVHDGLDLSYRKNKRDLSPSGAFPNSVFDYDPSIGNDVDGVDLNRNFSFNWAFGDTFLEPDNSDYASHYDYYKGEEPFSENESIAIRDLALENDFVFSIVWHSSRSGNLSEKVFTSWKWDETKESPDLGIMKSIADEFAGNIPTEDGSSTYLSVFSGSRNGKLHDWFYRETGCIQYLVECGTSNLQPHALLLENTIYRTKPAMVYLMDRAIGYYTDAGQITGIVRDNSSGIPIEGVEVEVLEHTGSVLKPRLTNEFGRYRRILDAGTYTLLFKSEGFEPKQLTVTANNSGITQQDVYLTPEDIYQISIDLQHDGTEIIEVEGTVSNEFSVYPITIYSGSNSFSFRGGNYKITFLMDGEFMPWEMNFALDSDIHLTVPYDLGTNYDLNLSLPWPHSVGEWYYNGSLLCSQEDIYYENGILADGMLMESDLYDINGSNRVVVSVDHRFETEWDHDEIRVSILDQDNNILGTKAWTGNEWDEFREHLIYATTDGSFSSARVRIEFSPDETVNYRGWEIREIRMSAINDAYVSITENSRNYSPKIPLRISGIYPNPSYGNLLVNINNLPAGNAVLNIYNILGQNVFSRKITSQSKADRSISLDLGSLEGHSTGSGMFFIQIQSASEQAVKKCIIIKN